MKHLASPQSDPRQFLTDLFKIAVRTADPMQIASGRTIGEASTARDALAVIDRYNISVRPHLRDSIERSAIFAPDDPRLVRASTQIVAAWAFRCAF